MLLLAIITITITLLLANIGLNYYNFYYPPCMNYNEYFTPVKNISNDVIQDLDNVIHNDTNRLNIPKYSDNMEQFTTSKKASSIDISEAVNKMFSSRKYENKSETKKQEGKKEKPFESIMDALEYAQLENDNRDVRDLNYSAPSVFTYSIKNDGYANL